MLKVHVVAPSEMLKGIPDADLPKNEADFWRAVADELHNLIVAASAAQSLRS